MKLDKYSNPSSERPAARPARKYDPDQCPSGYDLAIWSLTLLFQQLAAKDGIQLQAGRPIIYGCLAKRMEETGASEVLVESAMREFWTYWQDEHALDAFCGVVRFNEMISIVRERARNKRLVAKAKAQRAARG